MGSRVLVCGGGGYIGAHMVRYLSRAGHDVDVLDNFSTGHRAAVLSGTLVEGDLLSPDSLESVFTQTRFDAVMHFCARSLVGESVRHPYDYYRNNVVGTLNLLDVMRRHNVDKLVFSSTAAVFGHPQHTHIDEQHPCAPINPYGQSKRMVELILEDAANAYGLRSVALRYFNAAGADPSGEIGESHDPETHLIPNLFRSVLGLGPRLTIFGQDYDTPDGTCVRDYVHVNDLADAHLRALEWMSDHPGAVRFNLGNGKGFSVREIIDSAGEVVGRPVEFDSGSRRAGDPAVLVASSEKARTLLGWCPRYREIGQILETAWRWHQDPRY